jgi:hypothetical protein
MKKILVLLVIPFLLSCGPSKSEREAAEKRSKDSIDQLIEQARYEGTRQDPQQEPARKERKEAKVRIESSGSDETMNVRNDLNGQLLKAPNRPEVYWIDEGLRRHIQSPQLLQAFFNSGNVAVYPDLNLVPMGSPITRNNRLIKCSSNNSPLNGKVYFLDNGRKRHIVSESSFKNNNFNWSGISNVDCSVLNSLPTGSAIR